MKLGEESRETLELYGCEPDKPSFARACLLARTHGRARCPHGDAL